MAATTRNAAPRAALRLSALLGALLTVSVAAGAPASGAVSAAHAGAPLTALRAGSHAAGETRDGETRDGETGQTGDGSGETGSGETGDGETGDGTSGGAGEQTGALASAVGDTVLGGEALGRPGVVTDLPPGVPAPPAPPAASWLIADLDSGDVIAASHVHRPLAPASTLKVLTALALVPRIDPEVTYTASHTDAAVDGSKVGLVPGSRYTVSDLLHGLLLGSGNDCASALATIVGGTRQAAELMNEEARRLGARDTVAATPHGLDAPGQVSSAYDLALVTRAALEDRRVGRVMATTRYRFPAGGKALDASRKRFEIQNHNRLLRNYAGAGGGKTGYTEAARHSFVGSAERGGRRLVVTMMRAEGRTSAHTAKLLDWAFGPGAGARPVGHLVTPDDVAPQPTPAPPADGARDAAAPRAAALPEQRPSGADGVLGPKSLPVLAGVLVAALAVGALLTRSASRSRRRPGEWWPPARHRT